MNPYECFLLDFTNPSTKVWGILLYSWKSKLLQATQPSKKIKKTSLTQKLKIHLTLKNKSSISKLILHTNSHWLLKVKAHWNKPLTKLNLTTTCKIKHTLLDWRLAWEKFTLLKSRENLLEKESHTVERHTCTLLKWKHLLLQKWLLKS